MIDKDYFLKQHDDYMKSKLIRVLTGDIAFSEFEDLAEVYHPKFVMMTEEELNDYRGDYITSDYKGTVCIHGSTNDIFGME